jgi:hypothetical protein
MVTVPGPSSHSCAIGPPSAGRTHTIQATSKADSSVRPERSVRR